MYTINFTKECGCFTRSGMENNQCFSSKEEARVKAEAMIFEAKNAFCEKHNFELCESENGFTVNVTMAE